MVRELAVPALLVVVVAGQLLLAPTASLTPWKGGGFGMFATLDHLDPGSSSSS